jgi:hypothetical protein
MTLRAVTARVQAPPQRRALLVVEAVAAALQAQPHRVQRVQARPRARVVAPPVAAARERLAAVGCHPVLQARALQARVRRAPQARARLESALPMMPVSA